MVNGAMLPYLLRKSLAILFRPVTIGRYGFHRRSALRSTRTRALHLGFGHAGAGLRLQAGTNIDDSAVSLSLVL